MDQFMLLYGALVLVAAGLAGITLWGARSFLPQASALGLAGLLMFAGYVGLMDVLGRPKPVTVEWSLAQMEEATVVAARLHEGEAIYLWLEMEEPPEPRAYVLPWNLEDAKELSQALREGEEQGTAVRMRAESEPTAANDQPLFYAEPQTALPAKVTEVQ